MGWVMFDKRLYGTKVDDNHAGVHNLLSMDCLNCVHFQSAFHA